MKDSGIFARRWVCASMMSWRSPPEQYSYQRVVRDQCFRSMILGCGSRIDWKISISKRSEEEREEPVKTLHTRRVLSEVRW